MVQYRAGCTVSNPIVVSLSERERNDISMDFDGVSTRYTKASYAQSKSFPVYSIFNVDGELIEITNLETTHTFAEFQLKTHPTGPVDLFDQVEDIPDLPDVYGSYPEWNRTRAFLTGQHIWTPRRSSTNRDVIPDDDLMNDMLFVFMGLSGQYLGPKFFARPDGHRGVSFEIRGKLEATSHALVSRMLPLCEDVLIIQRFMELRSGIEFGTVCHAISAAIQCIMDDWLLLVTQLEGQLLEGKLSLQNLWFYVQPAMSVLSVLSEICKETSVHDLRGTELLNLLHSKILQFSGSQNSQALLQKLLEAGCVPYFQVLEKWLCEGVLHDPYSEFMIEEDPQIHTTMTTTDLQSGYWLSRYQLRKTYLLLGKELISIRSVPNFLQQQAEVILTTGKYLNAIKECGRQVKRPLSEEEHLVFDKTTSYQSLIQKAHKVVSQAFLDLFMKDLHLVDWLRGLKHFFLMDKGDMIGHLMDIAQEELYKIASQVVVNRMQSLLELASKISSIPSETNIESLRVELDHRSMVDLAVCLKQPQKVRSHTSSIRSSLQSSSFLPSRPSEITANQNRASNLVEELSGWDIFMICYKVEWPMMLIVPPKLMQIYQLLFKQLFSFRRAETELNKAWKVLQKTRKLKDLGMNGVLKMCQTTCHQMQYTVQQYLRYLTVHTIEPCWLEMEINLSKAKDIDKVIEIHKTFVEKVLWQSLLKKVKGVKELDKVINLSLLFARFIGTHLDVEVTTEEMNALISGLHVKPSPSELALERIRAFTMKIEAALKEQSFLENIARIKREYKTKLSSLVTTLVDYCDVERGESASKSGPEEFKSREDLDKLISLAETIKPH